MTIESKSWNWKIVNANKEREWLLPSQEVYYLIDRWKTLNKKSVLDLGCGIGRHALLFSKRGFNTYGLDLSEDAIMKAKAYSDINNAKIEYVVADMLNLPYGSQTMNAVFAYYSISHTDTSGVIRILEEIRRILTINGECYLTFGSKNSWGYKEEWPIVDDNTKIRIEDGPDNGVPHFFADSELIYNLFEKYEIIDLRQIQRIENENDIIKSHHHYHVLAKKK